MRDSDVKREIERMTNNRMGNEPVAWVNKERNTITWDKLYPDMDALYSFPPQHTWEGLTDEEIVLVLGNVREKLDGNVFGSFAKAIEAKLKEKNT